MAVALDVLRRRIRELEGRPPAARRGLCVGWSLIDRLGGLPRPGVVALEAPIGAGGTRVLLRCLAASGQRAERAVWIEPPAEEGWPLHPPEAARWGVDLSRLLIVRASAHQGAWVAEQAAASGACGLVVLGVDLPVDAGPRLIRAARRGHCTLIVVAEQVSPSLRAHLVIQVRDGLARVQRRGAPVGGQASVPCRGGIEER